ncbi:hypothetical protein DSL72_002197 [Monilinia vaccinii-corymbosi]|uniref:LEM-like domain-containing protein n=1 Tax=Monilinia vaccinii-corymbosi TaxID=61207 RepID=A0A8A3PC22_9HELO|nr:hypothetical protein DSL72_002197 [Monilinia vaccinii-corymbosi]
MPRIRSLLVAHDIAYPSNAKKAQLVEIFNQDLVPLAGRLWRERLRAKRTSQGIFDAESSSSPPESTAESPQESDAILPPPRTRPARQSPSKMARASVDISDDEPATNRNTRRSTRSVSPVKMAPRPSTRYSRQEEEPHSDEEDLPQTISPTKRIPRASSPVKWAPRPSTQYSRQEEEPSSDEEDVPQTISPAKRILRARSPVKGTPRPSTKHPRQEADEPHKDEGDVLQNARKSRKSTAIQTSMFGARDNLDGIVKTRDPRRETNFTFDNPFQSGSPPSENRRPLSGHENKRKSLGGSAAKEMVKGRTSVSRRRTATPQANDEIHPPSSSTFEMPVSSLDGLKDYDDNGVEIGEDFTPEAQFELEREQQRGLSKIQPRRKQSNGFSMSGPIWMILMAILGGYAAWYRQEKIAVGFCGVGREAHSIIPITSSLPDWVQLISGPRCDMCPQHAYCNTNYEVQCDQDFVLKHHPLSMGGFLPLPPTCEPDGEKVRRVKAVADRAVEELRERRAKWECGDLVDETGAPEPTVEIGTEKLKKLVGEKRRKGMGEAEFEELWLGAIGEIKGRDEVVVGADGSNTLKSTSFARLPLACAIKRSFRRTMARYHVEIGSLGLGFVLFFYIRSLIRSRAATNAAIPALVSLTLSRLATQASLYAQNPDVVKESWISIGQLRDDVLRDEHTLKKREKIWAKVRKVVEMNSNVRSMQRESHNGEISRVWEWIGALEDIEGSVRRRKSGRASWVTPSKDQDEEDGEKMTKSRWEEPGSRPIF